MKILLGIAALILGLGCAAPSDSLNEFPEKTARRYMNSYDVRHIAQDPDRVQEMVGGKSGADVSKMLHSLN